MRIRFVVVNRVILGTMVGALAVAGAFAMPAIGAPEAARPAGRTASGAFFTPASADPRLAALVARSGLDNAPFRFTPAESRGSQRRAIESALPVSAPKAVLTLRNLPNAGPAGIQPFAYNIGTAAPKRAPVMGDLKFDLVNATGNRKPMDIGTSFSGRRAANKFKATTEKTEGNDRLVTDPNNSIDVGGSYSLTKNIDVSAGLRYKAQDRDRLTRLTDDARRDSQSVYVGTAFRF